MSFDITESSATLKNSEILKSGTGMKKEGTQ